MISIIVPVYNVKQYLEKCIMSVVRQTYKDWELLLVDDGSTDGSGKICDYYNDSYSNIHSFHKKNGGQSSARNYGLDKMKGEFVCFVDSDDWLDIHFLEIVMNDFNKTQADIISTNYFISDDKNKREAFNISCNALCDNERAMEKLMRNEGTSSSVCPRLYKVSLFKNLRFEEGMLFEDAAISYKIFEKAHTVYFEKESLYYYYQRNDSTMSRKDKKIRFDEIRAGYERYRNVSKKYNYRISELAFTNFVYDLVHVEECFVRDGYNTNELIKYLHFLKNEKSKMKYNFYHYLSMRKKVEACLMLNNFYLFKFIVTAFKRFSKRNV